jgi:hypothetical protein
MAHPSNAFPKEFVVIDGAQTATGNFFAIQVLAAADTSLTVKGSGIRVYVDIDAAIATEVVKYINPDTGVAFPAIVNGSDGDLADGKAAGFYERVSTVDTVIPCAAGNTIYGNFNSITGTASDKIIAYLK